MSRQKSTENEMFDLFVKQQMHRQEFNEKPFDLEELDVGISNNMVFRHKRKIELFIYFGFFLMIICLSVGIYGAVQRQKEEKELWNTMMIAAFSAGGFLLLSVGIVGAVYIKNMFKLLLFALLATPNVRQA